MTRVKIKAHVRMGKGYTHGKPAAAVFRAAQPDFRGVMVLVARFSCVLARFGQGVTFSPKLKVRHFLAAFSFKSCKEKGLT
jgi:hypothetical protein